MRKSVFWIKISINLEIGGWRSISWLKSFCANYAKGELCNFCFKRKLFQWGKVETLIAYKNAVNLCRNRYKVLILLQN